MEKKFELTIIVSAAGTDAEKEQLLANMIKRIEAENATVGQATARVSSVVEK